MPTPVTRSNVAGGMAEAKGAQARRHDRPGAPAGPVEIAQLKEYAQTLEKAGYHVMIPEGIERKAGYLAGSDERASRRAQRRHP